MMLRIALGVFLFIALLIVGFALAIPHANRDQEEAPITDPVPPPEASFTDSYSKGEHIISGYVVAPTPCTSLTTEASVASGTPATIRVDVLMPPDEGICIQVIANLPFEVSATAPADAVVELYVNGARAKEPEIEQAPLP